jgi:hypothetical protein
MVTVRVCPGVPESGLMDRMRGAGGFTVTATVAVPLNWPSLAVSDST